MPNQIDRWLTKINTFIWPTEQNIDYRSVAFYVFKAFPKNLKKSEIAQWAQLQADTLSPFSNGDKYQHISRLGLHLWVSNAAFTGVPETAGQNKLPDGQHVISGSQQHYHQKWQGGLMLSCQAIDSEQVPHVDGSVEMSFQTPWAVERKIDVHLKQPSTWLALCGFVGLCGLVWGVAGYTAINTQSAWAEQKSSALSDSIGDKLALQNTLRNNQQILTKLQSWHTQSGFFPETFADVAEKLSLQGEWRANTVLWQNKIIELEFVSKNVDITSLVGELEKLSNLEQVNIRPHNAEHTWILEAKLK